MDEARRGDSVIPIDSETSRDMTGAAMTVTEAFEHHEEGFPQVAAFLNSDEDNLIMRKFGNIHARLLLYRQDELAELEHDLIIRMRTFVSLPAPRPRIFKVFATWMLEKKPLYSKEMSFLDQSSDLITLAEGQERGWLDGVVENLLACSALAVFTKAYVTPILYARIPSIFDEEVERRQGSWYPRKRHEQFAATAA
ncbi:MAG: hypothetical protein Q9175_004363 [Cornicularia normoerica]